MITEDQTEVMTFLACPSTHGGAPVERIETHASVVFLAAARAWKLKRAVRYDYLDFSTIERRKAMCEAEVRINRRAAPTLYRGVVPITREPDGSLALGGSGPPLDWVIEMVRFSQDDLFDRLAARQGLNLDLMPPLAAAIAQFHESADRSSDHGGAEGMRWVVDGNAAGFAEEGAGILDPAQCADVTHTMREQIDRHSQLLNRRRDHGFVRQCHGDLHLRNIVLLDGRPTLFDAIEFNDDIACTDMLYDTAFLLMDLWRRRLQRHANAVWNAYFTQTSDVEGLPLLPLFLACRAAVRAKTSVTAASLQTDQPRKRELQEMAVDYLTMAQQLLRPPPACLIAIGGFSGSGKSTLAKALAPQVGAVPGAVVIRSDEIRKQLCGVDPHQQLGLAGYSAGVTRRVYDTIRDRAAQVIRAGATAVADAVYPQPADRQEIERVAADAQLPFVGLWLDAPEAVLRARIEQRRLDVSDADATVITRQLRENSGAIAWVRIDASGTIDKVLSEIIAVLRKRLQTDMIRTVTPIA